MTGRKAIDETGNVYGKITVLYRDHKRFPGQGAYWICQCTCGNVSSVRGTSLRYWGHKSCGCSITKPGRRPLPPGEAAFNAYFSKLQHGVKKRNLPLELTEAEVKELIRNRCYYCGAEPVDDAYSKKYNGEFARNGIDRVDNNKGYTLDNVVPCCKHCNQAKHTRSLEDFLNWAQQLAKYSVRLLDNF